MAAGYGPGKKEKNAEKICPPGIVFQENQE
jgi:hypothetical protein